MKKKIKIIKIIPIKKNISNNMNNNNNNKKLNFNKVVINNLFSFFDLKEKINLSKINKNFKNNFLNLNNILNSESSDFIKYLSFLLKFEEKSENYSPFLNVFFDINFINLSKFKFKSISKGAIKSLILFINYRYEKTKNKNFFLTIFSNEDFNLNKEIILNLNNFKQLKFTLRLNNNFNIENSIELFKKIPFVKFVNDDRKKSLEIYKKIQNFIIKNEIEAFHYKIFVQKNENLINYFNKYKNHLFCLSNEKDFDLIENNIESIFKYENNLHSILIKNPKLKLKIIKFSFAHENFNENFDNLNLEFIENFGGFLINENEIDFIIEKMNKMKNLRKLNNIQFGIEDDSKILLKFLEKNKINFECFSLWFSRISNEKNGIEKLLNFFPNLRKFYENSDCSGIYDSSVTINNCFNVGMNKNLFEKNNLNAILKLIKNYLNHQKIGKKFIKFDAIYDSNFIPLLIKNAFENNEKNVINSIHSINFIVGGPIVNEIKEIEKLIYFDFNNEQECIFNSLKNVKKVHLIKISELKYLNENFNLIKQFNPDFIFFNEDFNDDVNKKFEEIQCLKYVFVNEENYEKWKNKMFKFEIFPANVLTDYLE